MYRENEYVSVENKNMLTDNKCLYAENKCMLMEHNCMAVHAFGVRKYMFTRSQEVKR